MFFVAFFLLGFYYVSYVLHGAPEAENFLDLNMKNKKIRQEKGFHFSFQRV